MNSLAPLPASSSHRLLIVDDNRDIHEDIRKILGSQRADPELDSLEAELFGEEPSPTSFPQQSFVIDSATQGQEALELVRRATADGVPYSLAFVDMRMPPGWDGVTTIEHLWKVDPSLQIVICTAYSDHSWHDIVQRLQAFERLLIIKKPFDNVEIVQTAYNLSHKWSLERQLSEQMVMLNQVVEEKTADLKRANNELQKRLADLHRMESELRLAQKLESVGQLAAGVAHELNTPAQFVTDNLGFLADSNRDLNKLVRAYQHYVHAQPPCREQDTIRELEEAVDVEYLLSEIPSAISQSIDGMKRTAEIVRALKQFCHPSTGERNSMDVNAALDTTLTVARNEWKYVAELELNLAPDLPQILALCGEMNQVFLNLIVNAAHAMADTEKNGHKGILSVTTRQVDADRIEIAIGDTGSGIADDIKDKVFDPFFTTKGVGKGTGQGLALVHNVVVTQHGGDVRLETEVGKGTTFYVRLPLRPRVEA